MVTEGNAEVAADIGERRRIDIPDSARQLDRALKRIRGCAQTSLLTTRVQHRTVERSIMGCEKRHVSQASGERRPQLTKCWSVGNVSPRDAMHIGKHEVAAWRTNVVVGTIDDRIPFDTYHGNGTRTIATVVGGLEVDGGERWGVRESRSVLSAHFVLHISSASPPRA